MAQEFSRINLASPTRLPDSESGYQELVDTVNAMLASSETERPSATQICSMPWLQNKCANENHKGFVAMLRGLSLNDEHPRQAGHPQQPDMLVPEAMHRAEMSQIMSEMWGL